jgi:hypothetical protein
MYGKEGHLCCASLLLEVPDKNFVLYKIELISSYRSVNVTVNKCLEVGGQQFEPYGAKLLAHSVFCDESKNVLRV